MVSNFCFCFRVENLILVSSALLKDDSKLVGFGVEYLHLPRNKVDYMLFESCKLLAHRVYTKSYCVHQELMKLAAQAEEEAHEEASPAKMCGGVTQPAADTSWPCDGEKHRHAMVR